jgi:hypothetical protein
MATALDIAVRARRFLAVRAPALALVPLTAALKERNFNLVYADASSPRISPLEVFASPS